MENRIYTIPILKYLCKFNLLCACRMWPQPLTIISRGLNGLLGKKLLLSSPSASCYLVSLWDALFNSLNAFQLINSRSVSVATGARKMTLNSKVTIMGIRTLVVLVGAFNIHLQLKWLAVAISEIIVIVSMLDKYLWITESANTCICSLLVVQVI